MERERKQGLAGRRFQGAFFASNEVIFSQEVIGPSKSCPGKILSLKGEGLRTPTMPRQGRRSSGWTRSSCWRRLGSCRGSSRPSRSGPRGGPGYRSLTFAPHFQINHPQMVKCPPNVRFVSPSCHHHSFRIIDLREVGIPWLVEGVGRGTDL